MGLYCCSPFLGFTYDLDTRMLSVKSLEYVAIRTFFNNSAEIFLFYANSRGTHRTKLSLKKMAEIILTTDVREIESFSSNGIDLKIVIIFNTKKFIC